MQFIITTTGIQSRLDIFDESMFVMTFLAFLGVTEILCSFRLVLEERTGKEIPKSKFPTNSFALWDIGAGHVTSRKTVYPKNLSCGPGLSISIFVYTGKLSCLNISVFIYVRKPHFLNSSIFWYIRKLSCSDISI